MTFDSDMMIPSDFKHFISRRENLRGRYVNIATVPFLSFRKHRKFGLRAGDGAGCVSGERWRAPNETDSSARIVKRSSGGVAGLSDVVSINNKK